MADQESSGCVFCAIAAGEVPADVVHRSESVVAFRDLDPQAPTHVLVIPVAHHRDVAALAAADGDVLAEMARVGTAVAEQDGLDGWRLVFNTGASVGQSVFHVHGHVLGRPRVRVAARLSTAGRLGGRAGRTPAGTSPTRQPKEVTAHADP